MTTCPDCNGNGEYPGGAFLEYADGSGQFVNTGLRCRRCIGVGAVPDEMIAEWIPMGLDLLEARLDMDVSFRSVATKLGVKASTVSAWESGREKCPYTVDEYKNSINRGAP